MSNWFRRVEHFFHREVRAVEQNPLGFALTGIPGKGADYNRLISWAVYTNPLEAIPAATLGIQPNSDKTLQKQAEHFAHRELFYTSREMPYVAAVVAALASYFFSPVAGAAIAALFGEGERWLAYYNARDNKDETTWEARREGRRYADRTWEYGAAGAAGGSIASFGVSLGASAFQATPTLTTALNPVSQSLLEQSTLQAGQQLAETEAANASLAPTVFASTPAPGILGSAWNTISSLPSLAWSNPTAALGLAGTGLGVAGSLGYLGKSGQQVATDVTLGSSLASDLGNLNAGLGAGGGGGPGLGGGGGTDLSAGFGPEAPQQANIISGIDNSTLVMGGVVLILAVVLLG